jgi:uncharacterized protein involved in exopolysaccharide biosynthesis
MSYKAVVDRAIATELGTTVHAQYPHDAQSNGSIEKLTDDDSLDIARYRRVLSEKRLNFVIATSVGVLLAMLLLQILPFQYTATVVVRPPDTSSTSISSALSSLSGLSGLSGVLGSADSSDYDAFNQLLNSNELSEYIVKQYPQLLPKMFPTHWDATNKKWTNDGLGNALKSFIKAILGFQAWQPPNSEDVEQYVSKYVSVSNSYTNNFTTISFTAQDPVFAQDMVDAVYMGADAIVRAQARNRAEKRIAYLEKVLPSVTQTDERLALIQLLAASEQTMMTVSADQYYSMSPVDRPILSARPSWPPNILIIIGLALVAFVFEYVRLVFFPNLSPARWFRRGRTVQGGGAVAHSSRIA